LSSNYFLVELVSVKLVWKLNDSNPTNTHLTLFLWVLWVWVGLSWVLVIGQLTQTQNPLNNWVQFPWWRNAFFIFWYTTLKPQSELSVNSFRAFRRTFYAHFVHIFLTVYEKVHLKVIIFSMLAYYSGHSK
jgi:hypothetical protein